MKILIIGLAAVDPGQIIQDERLINLHRLMDVGCFGRLYGTPTADAFSAWMSLLSGRDNETRADTPDLKNIREWVDSISQAGIWHVVEQQGRHAVLIWDMFSAQVDTAESSDDVYAASQKQFRSVLQAIELGDWHILLFIDTGVGDLRHLIEAGAIEHSVIDDYYSYLDEQLGMIFERLADETVVLVVSPMRFDKQQDGTAYFILASTNNPLTGEIYDVSLGEIAPTLLELGGYDIPPAMLGKSLAAGKAMDLLASGDLTAEEEAILRERLSGLGYIS